jgi:hypothetical protein
MKRTLIVIGAVLLCWVVVALGQRAPLRDQTNEGRAPNDDVRRLAKLASSYELARIHAKGLEPNEDFRPMWDKVFEGLLADTQLDASWKARIIASRVPLLEEVIGKEHATGDGRPEKLAGLTEFEERAIKKIEKGAQEVLEIPSRSKVLYLRPITPLKSCVKTCHASAMQSMGIKGSHISLDITLESKNVEPKNK